MSTIFDEKFETWLNEQLNSIKALSGFRRHRPLEQSRLHPAASSTASYHSCIEKTPGGLSQQKIKQKPGDLSRMSGRSPGGKHTTAGNYYRFTYDDEEDDIQSVDDDDEDDDEIRRRQRLSRILGDQCLEFGSGSERDVDENRNLFVDDVFGGDDQLTAASRANQYSTTSLEFSDTESFVSASGSDVIDATLRQPPVPPDDWRHGGRTADDDDGYVGGGLDGFVEFSIVRDETGRTLTDVGNDNNEDPLQYRETSTSGPPGSRRSGLLSIISGRGGPVLARKGRPGSSATSEGRRKDDIVAIRYQKTEVTTAISGESTGGDYMDDDDILRHPHQHQLAVGDSVEFRQNDNYGSPTRRTFLPTDLSMDIMSTDDAYNSPDFDDAAADEFKDRDPIVRTPTGSPVSRSLPLQLGRTLSVATSGRAGTCVQRRRLLIALGIVTGLLLMIGIGVGIYFIVRQSS